MPDSPAQHTFVLTKAEYGATTERMATPEELLALQLLAEEEEAVIKAIESAAELPAPEPVAAPEPVTPEPVIGASTDSDSVETAVSEPKATDPKEEHLNDLGELASEVAVAPRPV